MKPMLAVACVPSALRFPLYASPKLDGVRATVVDGVIRSRRGNPIPNVYVRSLFSKSMYDGLDGELIVGKATDEGVLQTTQGALNTVKWQPKVTFHVFDNYKADGRYQSRLATLFSQPEDHVELVPQRLIGNLEQLLALEAEVLDRGYEGLMLRSMQGVYKQGRCTVNEGWLLKFKRFVDSEAVITGVEESDAMPGLMGALLVRDVKLGVDFKVGTGFSMQDRRRAWQVGSLIKYKVHATGAKVPVYIAPRHGWDL